MTMKNGKIVAKKIETKNQGDLGGKFIVQAEGLEESVNNYLDNIGHLYVSAYEKPSKKDQKIIEKMEREKNNKNNKSKEIRSNDNNSLIISINPDIKNFTKAKGMVFSVINKNSFSSSSKRYSRSSAVVASITAGSLVSSHKYIYNGSSNFHSMDALVNPDAELDIGIKLFRSSKSAFKDAKWAGGHEYVETSGGSGSWRLNVYKEGNGAGGYSYEAKWSRT